MFKVDIGETTQKTYNQFVSDWKNQMNEAIQIAQQKGNKSAEQNRNQYNSKVHGKSCFSNLNLQTTDLYRNNQTRIMR